jgi:hypothetical protein
MGKSFASLLKVPFFETSARAPKSVATCFKSLILEAQRKVHDHVSSSLTAAGKTDAAASAGAGGVGPRHMPLSNVKSFQGVSNGDNKAAFELRRGSDDSGKKTSSDSQSSAALSRLSQIGGNSGHGGVGSGPRLDFLPGTTSGNPALWKALYHRRPSDTYYGTLASVSSASSSNQTMRK